MDLPGHFPFPFQPYPIQVDFMKNLYWCLENGFLGIFESPTGTGKTLSIICGALKWLIDHEEKEKNHLLNEETEITYKIKKIEANNENDWFLKQSQQIQLNLKKQVLQKKLNALLKQEEKKLKYKEQIKQYHEKNEKDQQPLKAKWKNIKKNKKEEFQMRENENEFIDVDLILNDINYQSDSAEEEFEEETYQNCKIFFCSRTHSQLTQFIGELKKSPYSDKISLVSLASRNNYCINTKIKSLKNISIINEQCQLLQKSKSLLKKEKDLKRSKISTLCPFMPGNQSLLMAEILTSIRDIEETVKKGEEIKSCPYYATRKSVESGQVILVPYNSILHKSTRISSGINLKGNVVIIDEAHNLLEAIERMYSVTITGKNLLYCFNQLSQYKKRFENVLTAKNVLFLSQLSFCMKKLLKLLGGNIKSHPSDKPDNATTTKLYSIEDFESIAEIDTINIFDLINFIQKSKLVHKLHKYIEKYHNNPVLNKNVQEKKGIDAFLQSFKKQDNLEIQDNPSEHLNKLDIENIGNPLTVIMNFLESLKTNCNDGRIFIVPDSTIGQGYLKFILLNPALHFSDIVQEARSVILTGGTMEPMSEFKEQLFISAGAEPERIITFSCDHVIPKENILTCVINSGPTEQEFEFNYQNRYNVKMLDELGRTLINLCNVVPAGIVVFLPSYNYEDLLFKHLESNAVLKKISLKKSIYREPKLTSQVNQILEKYSNAIKNPLKPRNGAILFSVVGGKLSEGLNFSDDLGRCVVVVGMPYPNIKSPELKEKIKYLNENVNSNAGNIFYENSCMKAVNQCIGRAVRHVADYSTVVLLDKRYSNKTKSLPKWIQRTLTLHTRFSTAIDILARFFNAKKQLKNINVF